MLEYGSEGRRSERTTTDGDPIEEEPWTAKTIAVAVAVPHERLSELWEAELIRETVLLAMDVWIDGS